MAIKATLSFLLDIQGDGTSTSITVDIRKHPIFWQTPLGYSLEPAFDLLRNPPDDVLGSVGGNTFALSGFLLTINFGVAPTGQTVVGGLMLYNGV